MTESQIALISLEKKAKNALIACYLSTCTGLPGAGTPLDLSQTATNSDSLKLGKAVLSELGGVNALHRQSVEQAGFAVLKSPDIPSILVETVFISNPAEERKLNDDGYQEKMASAFLASIKRYFAKNPPLAKSRLARSD